MAYLRNIEIDPKKINSKIDEFNNRVERFKNNKLVVSFSCGKDSVVLLDLLISNKIKCEPVHYYIVPDLSYNEEVMTWFEDKYRIKVNRIVSPIYTKMKSADLLCVNRIWNLSSDKQNPFKRAETLINKTFNFDWNAVGIKQNDSVMRRMTIVKHGWIYPNTKKIYPLYDWSDRDVWAYMHYKGMPINKCYEWFGRSQDVVNIPHIYPLKEKSPEDYFIFCKNFPLIEPLIWKYEIEQSKIKKQKSNAR
jgi:phosphoadenosine phosphosulfate reductase